VSFLDVLVITTFLPAAVILEDSILSLQEPREQKGRELKIQRSEQSLWDRVDSVLRMNFGISLAGVPSGNLMPGMS
jgi:hypothetical protein